MIHVHVSPLDRAGIRWAQDTVTAQHYLRAPVDPRCSVEGYAVEVAALGRVGALLFGRPEATRCADWYGGVDDVAAGRCEVTRWQTLNLARVWLDPRVQAAGEWHHTDHLPGFTDRRGVQGGLRGGPVGDRPLDGELREDMMETRFVQVDRLVINLNLVRFFEFFLAAETPAHANVVFDDGHMLTFTGEAAERFYNALEHIGIYQA